MADVLDQSDIDALLAAVDDDSVEEGTGGGDTSQIFSSHGSQTGNVEVRPYDFKRPERVSKDQILALESLHEGFSRAFGAGLSGFLRTIVEVNVSNIEQMTFSEFTHSLPTPTCFSLLGCDRLEGNVCLEISPLIIYPIIDRLLGGSNADLFIPQRPLTNIEMRLVSKIIDRAVIALQEAWENIIAVKFHLEETESNPQLVQIVPPNEVVVVVGFEVKMGGRAGTMSLCIPYAVIEPVIEKLSNQAWSAYKKHNRDPRVRRRVARHLDSAKMTLTTVLANTHIKVNELQSLQVDDIILTSKPAKAPLTLLIGGKQKFIGHLGDYKGNRAFKVKRVYSPKDRV